MTPQQAADRLEGTSRTLDDVLADAGLDFEAMDLEWLRELDAAVICCDCCGWWVEAATCNADGICEDCEE